MRAAAEHEGRADEHRVADAVGDDEGFGFVGGGAGFGLLEVELVEQGGEELAVFGLFDGFRRGADDRDAVAFEVGGEVERGLAAELDDDAVGFFLIADVEHVFECERLEEEFVGGVVVGGDGLGVRVHHDGLVAEFLQREGGVDAAVVELDALADAVRSAAEDDDFLFVRLAGFVFVAVGGVEIRRVGLELRGAGIDEAVGRDDAFGFALGADRVLGRDIDDRAFRFGAGRGTGGLVVFAVDGSVVDGRRGGAGLGDLAVGEAEFLRTLRDRAWRGSMPSFAICWRWRRNHGSIWVASKISSSVQPFTKAVCSQKMRSAFGIWSLRVISSRVGDCGSLLSKPKPQRPVSSERRHFCMDSLKVRPMDIASPTDFIEVVRTGLAVGNFSKVKRGILVTT